MGIESDQEIVQMIGVEEEVLNYFAATIEEGNMLQIYTKAQALSYLASKIRQKQLWSRQISKLDECKQLLTKTLLAHVSVSNGSSHKTAFKFVLNICQEVFLNSF